MLRVLSEMADSSRRTPAGLPAPEIPDLEVSPPARGLAAKADAKSGKPEPPGLDELDGFTSGIALPTSPGQAEVTGGWSLGDFDLEVSPLARGVAAKVAAKSGKPEPPGLDELDGFTSGMALPASPEQAAADGLPLGDFALGIEEDSAFAHALLEPAGEQRAPAGGRGRALSRRGLTGTTPEPGTLDLDPDAIRELGDFGDVPRVWYLAPGYALRVLGRRRALRARLGELKAALQAAEEARDRLLAETLRVLPPELKDQAQYRRVLDDASEAETVTQQRLAALGRADAEYATRAQDLERQKSETRRLLGERGQVLRELENTLAAREQALQRSEARLKRLGIELRNLRAPAAQIDPEASPLAEQAIVVKMHELEPDVSAKRAEAERARALVVTARSQRDRLERQLGRLEREQRELEHRSQRELGARGGSVEQARGREQSAWADAARALLSRGELGWLDQGALAALRAREECVWTSALALEQHRRALVSYDFPAVARGYRVMLVLAVVLVGLLLWAKLS
jgi:hypothetical protein